MRTLSQLCRHRLVCLVLSGAVSAIGCVGARGDNWNVEGEHGELLVSGALTEGACQLDMASLSQQVDLGLVHGADLRQAGDEAQPVTFSLKLNRCIREGGVQTNRYTGQLVWDPLQPVITLSFWGMTDPDMPSLIKVTGASGLGLRLEDSLHRTVRIGGRGEPFFVSSGNNALLYTVIPVRTPAPLTMGAFHATVNFQVEYD